MYTYYIAGIAVSDELYHDDLEGMTFGRRDQNELWHYGIKGQSWGKRRFQEEDGSLTAAGRNRYGVGEALGNAFKTVSNGLGRLPNTSNISSGSYAQPSKTGKARVVREQYMQKPSSNSTKSATSSTPQKVQSSANAGRSAADKLFGAASSAVSSAKNWAGNTAQNVGNAASNAYEGAKNWAGQAVKDVGNAFTNADERKAMEDAQRNADIQLTLARANSGYETPDGNEYIGRLRDVYNVEAAENKAREAERAYNNNPITKAQNWAGQAANDIRSGANNAVNSVKDFGSKAARNVGTAAKNAAYDVQGLTNTPAFRDAANAVNGAVDSVKNLPGKAVETAKNVGNAASNAYEGAKNLATSAANDIRRGASNAVNSVKDFGNNTAQNVANAANSVKDWWTGGDHGERAENARNIARSYENIGRANADAGIDKLIDSSEPEMQRIDESKKADSSAHYAKNQDDLRAQSDKQFNEGLAQRNRGYNQLDKASDFRNEAANEQSQYDVAPRQQIKAAGDWLGDRASDAKDWLGERARDVQNAANYVGEYVSDRASDVKDWASPGVDAVRNAATSVGDYASDRAQDVSDWYTGRFANDAASNFQRKVEAIDNPFPKSENSLIDYYQSNADAARKLTGTPDRSVDYYKSMEQQARKAGNYNAAEEWRQFAKEAQREADAKYEQAAKEWEEYAQKAQDDRDRYSRAAESWRNAYNEAPRQKITNAASNVAEWGAGAINNGKTALDKLFGKKK